MKWLNRLILLAGFLTLTLLLWRFSPAVVWANISQVGALGFCCIVPFQIIDHCLNATGWRFAFTAEDARGLPFWLLVKVRVAGDGVNYLTPSATIAGEFVRPGMLGSVRSEAARNTSVIVAKFAQALGQAVFILVGLLFLVLARLNVLEGRELVLSVGGSLLVVALICLALLALTSRTQSTGGTGLFARLGGERFAATRGQMRDYLRRYPGRFVASTICFTLGYAWGMLEVLLICYFMGMDVGPLEALAVETFSNIVDSLMFMVPAKIGTQEAGKAAIFHGLGYPASQGLAFGLIRHTREFIWASAGFLLYAFSQRGRAALRPTAD